MQNTNNSVHTNNEIDLASLINAVAAQKFIIAAILLISLGAGIAYTMLATPKYMATAQIAPGITDYDEKNVPIQAYKIRDIKTLLDSKGYYYRLKSAVYDSPESFPGISIETSKDSEIATISVRTTNADEGRKFLEEVLALLLSKDSQVAPELLNIGIARLEQKILGVQDKMKINRTSVKQHQNKINKHNNEIQELTETQQILIEDQKQIKEHILQTRKMADEVNLETAELMQLRKEMAAGGADKFALLMYANIIQQNIGYSYNLQNNINLLQEQASEKQMEAASSNREINDLKVQIDSITLIIQESVRVEYESLQSQLEDARKRLASLSLISVSQPPYTSGHPVSPNKRVALAISLLLGSAVALLVVFVRILIRLSQTSSAPQS